MAAPEASLWKDCLSKRVSWQQPVVKVYGRAHPVPRLSAFLAEQGIDYRYSGLSHSGQGWPGWFEPLRDQLCRFSGVGFNGCLLNLYRNGEDRMGWHADDEAEIDPSFPIASLSFGATRDLRFRHRNGKFRDVLELADGDLLLMHPSCQRDWQHSLPPRRRISTMRINLTFRKFKPSPSPHLRERRDSQKPRKNTSMCQNRDRP